MTENTFKYIFFTLWVYAINLVILLFPTNVFSFDILNLEVNYESKRWAKISGSWGHYFFANDVPKGVYSEKINFERFLRSDEKSLIELNKKLMVIIAANYNGAHFKKLEDTTIDNVEALLSYYTTKKDQELMHIDCTFFIKKYIYVISFSCIPSRYANAQKDFMAILKSIKLHNVK